MAAIAALGILPTATATAEAKHEKPRAAVTAKHKAGKKSKRKLDKRGQARKTAAAYTALSPSSGPGGTKVTVSGSHFARSKSGWIKFRGVKVADIKTDRYGKFSKVITVPSDAPVGSATLLAAAGAYPSEDSETFNVPSTTTSTTTVSDTTTTTSTASASLLTSLFDDSGWKNYSSDALSNTGYSATKSIVSSPTRSGSGAAKIHMPDPSATSHYMWRAKNVTWQNGDDAWLGLSMRLGDDWKITKSQLRDDSSTFTALFGFRGDVPNGPGGGLYATWHNGQPMFHSRTINGDSGSTSGRLYFGTIAKNVWYDFVVHVKWSTKSYVGVREYWLNGQKVGEWRGATMYTPMTVRNRIGIYQGGGIDHGRTVYYDNHRIGNSYSEVAPR